MPKPKTRVVRKRAGHPFSLVSPLKVVQYDPGELVAGGLEAIPPAEVHLANELLDRFQNAIARAGIVLSPGEGLEIVRLEMDEWSQEAREGLVIEIATCLDALIKTDKRASGEPHVSRFDHAKLLVMRFCPGAMAAPGPAVDRPEPGRNLTRSVISPEYRGVGPDERNRQVHATERTSRAEGVLPPIPVEVFDPSLSGLVKVPERFVGADPEEVNEPEIAAARLRAAFKQFAVRFRDRAKPLADEMTAIADEHRPLGTIRDLKAKDVAKITGLTVKRIYQLADAGILGERFGHTHWRFSESEAHEYLLEGHKPGPKPTKI